MSARAKKLSYIPELDGLRGCAILAVMLFHAHAPFMEGGFIGVDVFFVLSGFLITSLLVQEFDQTGTIALKKFYVRRALRLAPALIALLIVFCAVSFAILSAEQARSNGIDALISLAYLSNWARALSIHPPDVLGHTWSLSIEEQFYILWPLTLLMLLRGLKQRRHLVYIALSIALLSWLLRVYLLLAGASIERIYNALDTRLDGLMLGCIAGILLSSNLLDERIRARLLRWVAALAPLALGGLLAISIFGHWRDREIYYLGLVVVEIFTLVLLFNILIKRSGIVGKILRMRWLVWIGSISYGIYLWHYPIFRAMFGMDFRVRTVLTVGSLATVLVAALSYYVLERPALNYKQRFRAPGSEKPVLADSEKCRAADAV